MRVLSAIVLVVVLVGTGYAVTVGSAQSLGVSGGFPDCDVDANGDLHVCCRYPAAMVGQNQGVHYARFQTSGWDGNSTPPKESIPAEVTTWGCDWQFTWPRVAAGISGKAHVVWGTGRPWDTLYYREWTGSAWDPQETLIEAGGDEIATGPDIGVDSTGRVHIIYRSGGIKHIWKDGGGWSTPTLIYSDTTSKDPRLGIGSDDSLHVVYSGGPGGILGYNKRPDGGSWTSAVSVTGSDKGGFQYITTDSANKPLVVWGRFNDGVPDWFLTAIRWASKQNGTWDRGTVPTDGEIRSWLGWWYEYAPLPKIAVTPSGKRFVVWVDNDVLKYNVYENGSWLSTEQVLPQPVGLDVHPALAFHGEVGYVVYRCNNNNMLYINRIEFQDVLFDSFSPSETMDQTPDCSVGAQDPVNGIKPSTAQAEYSTDGAQNWLSHPATCTGSLGTTDRQTITAVGVPFNQDSQTLNKVRFSIENGLGVRVTSPAYNVAVGTPPETGWDAVWTGEFNQLPPEENVNWGIYMGNMGDCSVADGIMTVDDTITTADQGGCLFSWSDCSAMDPDVGMTLVYRLRKTNSVGENGASFGEVKTGHAKDSFGLFHDHFGTERQPQTFSVDASQWHVYRILAHREGMVVYLDEAVDHSLLVEGWSKLSSAKVFTFGFLDWDGLGTMEIDWAAAAFSGLYVSGTGPALPESAVPTATPTDTPTPTQLGEKGDMEPDGDFDLFDILRLVDIVLEIPPSPTPYEVWAGDMDDDGDHDLFDILALVDKVLEN